MSSLAEIIEAQRHSHTQLMTDEHKSSLGQYFTPYSIAAYMASLFPDPASDIVLLDPGAGMGSLTSAFLERAFEIDPKRRVKCVCYEIDTNCIATLYKNLSIFQQTHTLDFEIIQKDYIQDATDSLFSFDKAAFTHIIMNPPYKKIHSDSLPRKLLQSIGIDTVNLYAAFVSLAIEQLQDDGFLVAIIPRSFCNGVYYQSFRNHLFANTVIRKIHLFESRKSVFRDESVLQENIIILLQKNNVQECVKVSYSIDSGLQQKDERIFPYDSIADVTSKDKIINIPFFDEQESNTLFSKSLEDIQLKVSTGPVVDFRNKDYLRDNAENCVPLIYPFHIDNFMVKWPKANPKKPDNFIHNPLSPKLYYPKGFYVIVKRFSSKEEKRRIVAAIMHPDEYDYSYYAFENHVNLFHGNGKGLEEDIAWGLLCYLNSEMVDNSFRLFSGHTQVNAFDLRKLRYPDADTLIKLGQSIKTKALSYHTFETAIKEL